MNLRIHEAAEKIASKATLRAVRILGCALDAQLRRLRLSDDALTMALARIKELETRNGILTEMVETFQTRLRKIAPKKRPHYSGPARFKALQLRQTMGWSIEEAAAQFVVTPTTFTRWEDAADPARQTVGPDIQPDPPIRRYADVVRALVRLAERLHLGRAHQIAAHVARGGWKVSKSYVESVLKSEPTEASPDLPDSSSRMPLKATFVGHVFILDSHEVKSFLGFRKFWVTGVLDAYSQAPLGIHASATPPTADAAARLLKRVAAAWGRPRYVAIDGGPEFKGAFRMAAKRLGSRIRLGSPGRTTITGLIERFWRTLDWLMGLPLAQPLTLSDFEERLAAALNYYTYQRPIYSLDGATPAERLAGVQPKAATAIQPPRARPGINHGPPPMRVAWLDRVARRFPYLQPA
ncbi:MAG: hypothetical protein K1Y01_20235 [Vicinamibacteria bacterium]|nr:hypothetical protein [Vicinamibacteria bacterium]